MRIREALELCLCASPTNSVADVWERCHKLEPDNSIFAGHFPDNPILPAVVQCLMVQMLLEAQGVKHATSFTVQDAKFMAPIAPPCMTRVQAQQGRKAGQYVGTVWVDEVLCSKITLYDTTLMGEKA